MGVIRQVNLGFNKSIHPLPRKRTRPIANTPFSLRISQLRKQEGWTMTALAERIGVTSSYISLLEAGERQPSREIVLKLAQSFFGTDNVSATDELLVLAGLSPSHYELQHQPQDTQAMYEEHLRQHPDDFKIYTALIRLLIRQDQLKQAEEQIYAGMKRFHDAAQMQALMAQLQLCLKAYDPAANFQANAIALYRKQHKGSGLKKDPDYADLHVNLGVIYFLWGSEVFEASLQAGEPEQMAHLKQEALGYFQQALDFYRQAMEMTPDDIYLLDEYARISFNIADLSVAPERQQLWENAIACFVEVICAEEVGALGMASVREANAFLAHAYSKAEHFDEARKLIGVIQSCNPDYWLILYIKACHYSLRAAAGQSEAVEKGLQALKAALRNPHPQNTSMEYAQVDPDLNGLRQAQPEAFQALLSGNRDSLTKKEE